MDIEALWLPLAMPPGLTHGKGKIVLSPLAIETLLFPYPLSYLSHESVPKHTH